MNDPGGQMILVQYNRKNLMEIECFIEKIAIHFFFILPKLYVD